MKFFFILTTVLGCAWLSSCSDNKEGDEPEAPSGEICRIESVVWDSGYDIVNYSNFKFDNSGKIISYEYSYNDDHFGFYSKVETYTYGNGSIIVRDTEDGRIMATYMLENGLITSAIDYWGLRFEYSYDSDNRLITMSVGDDHVYRCEWKDGNLVSYTDVIDYLNHYKEYHIEYTNSPNKIGFIPVDIYDAYLDLGSDGRMFDAILCSEGYFGIVPKNLPSKIKCVEDADFDEITYANFNKKGYPAKMNVTYVYPNGQQGEEYSYLMSWSE